MLFLIYGTNYKLRAEAKKQIQKSLLAKGVAVDKLLAMPLIEYNNYKLLETYLKGNSLFGEKILINSEDLLSKAESRGFIYENLESLVESENIFILDEPFANVASYKKVTKDLEKLKVIGHTYDASEKIIKDDIEPFRFCELFVARNKKAAWQEWKKLYLKWQDTEAMALHGALWWKWKTTWSNQLAYSNNYAKFTISEFESFGQEIAYLAMRANAGEINLMRGIEKLIFKL